MQRFTEYLEEMKISLQYHDKLNPDLWNGQTLKPEVRKALIRFGETWAQFAKIPKSMIEDIVMTGGNANFNYTSKSDIDVHLIIKRNKLFSNPEFVEEYLQDKKSLWTLTHNITVYGYPLEPYAQDDSITYPRYQGVYSLMKDNWVVKPVRTRYDFTNDKILKQKVRHFMHAIDSMIKNKMGDAPIKNLKARFKDMRTSSIQKYGEFGRENLVFKELRNRGYLDKMTKYEKSLKDQDLTLKKE